jgi:hypothetical protein
MKGYNDLLILRINGHIEVYDQQRNFIVAVDNEKELDEELQIYYKKERV